MASTVTLNQLLRWMTIFSKLVTEQCPYLTKLDAAGFEHVTETEGNCASTDNRDDT